MCHKTRKIKKDLVRKEERGKRKRRLLNNFGTKDVKVAHLLPYANEHGRKDEIPA